MGFFIRLKVSETAVKRIREKMAAADGADGADGIDGVGILTPGLPVPDVMDTRTSTETSSSSKRNRGLERADDGRDKRRSHAIAESARDDIVYDTKSKKTRKEKKIEGKRSTGPSPFVKRVKRDLGLA